MPNANQTAVSPDEVYEIVSNIPPEVLDMLSGYLSEQDLDVLRQVNRQLAGQADDGGEWFNYLLGVREVLDQNLNTGPDAQNIELVISTVEIFTGYDSVDWTGMGDNIAQLHTTVSDMIRERALPWLTEAMNADDVDPTLRERYQAIAT